jgi:plasmid stability protein
VNIDDHLLEEARVLAAREHRSLGDVIDDALRIALSPKRKLARPRVTLPVSKGRLLVDLDDKEALADILGDNEWPRADR